MAKELMQSANVGHTEIATVQGGFGQDFMVHSERGVLRAKVAFSCLVTPEAGDRVLVNVSSSMTNGQKNESHIIAIIERQHANNMKLAFPGDVAMEAKAGNINLTAAKQVNLTSAESTKISSAELAVNVLDANVRAEKLSISGDSVTSQWRDVTSISDAMNLIVERMSQRFKNSFKQVEGVEQKNSKNYLQNVNQTLSVRSRDAVITARKDVKIDGERIHMG